MEKAIDFKNDDYLVHALAKNSLLRCLAARTTKLVGQAREIHDLSPASTVALGRLMTGALLMAADNKNESNQLSLMTRSDGDISKMTVVCEPGGRVRGEVYQAQAPSYYHRAGKLDIGKSLGKGSLTVVKDLGLREPYVGNVDLVSGEIAEDIAAYYYYSEQVPSLVFLGVRLEPQGVLAAGGILVQVMPGADDSLIDWLEGQAKGFPDISQLLADKVSPHQLLELLTEEPEINYIASKKLSYYCPCSRDRMQKNLLALGKVDLEELAQDPKGINLHCHFCEKNYHFSQAEIQDIVSNK